MNLLTITGIGASLFTATSMIPQLVKLIREKKAGDVSLIMLCVLFLGVLLWICYGILKNDLIIILFQFVVFNDQSCYCYFNNTL